MIDEEASHDWAVDNIARLRMPGRISNFTFLFDRSLGDQPI